MENNKPPWPPPYDEPESMTLITFTVAGAE